MSELPQRCSVPRPGKEYADLPKWQKLRVYLEFSDQKSHGRILCCWYHHNLNLFIYHSTDICLSAVSEFRKCCPWNRKTRMSDLCSIRVKVDYKTRCLFVWFESNAGCSNCSKVIIVAKIIYIFIKLRMLIL